MRAEFFYNHTHGRARAHTDARTHTIEAQTETNAHTLAPQTAKRSAHKAKLASSLAVQTAEDCCKLQTLAADLMHCILRSLGSPLALCLCFALSALSSLRSACSSLEPRECEFEFVECVCASVLCVCVCCVCCVCVTAATITSALESSVISIIRLGIPI